MGRSVDFYFSCVSPWVYVGDRMFRGLVAKHDLNVIYKPVSLRTLFANTGGLPLAQRAPVRQAYRWMELQRWRDARGIEMNFKPAHWPFPTPTADHIVMALQDGGTDPAPLISRFLQAIWTEERNLGEDATLSELMAEVGLPAEDLLAAAHTPEMAERHAANTAEAAEAGVFGSPGVVLDGEVFWGQDRYELLDAALTSGRAPYRPL